MTNLQKKIKKDKKKEKVMQPKILKTKAEMMSGNQQLMVLTKRVMVKMGRKKKLKKNQRCQSWLRRWTSQNLINYKETKKININPKLLLTPNK